MLIRSRSYRPSIWARLLLVGDWKVTLNGSYRDQINVKTASEEIIRCLDLTSVSTTKALLWHTVELRSKTRTISLSGLTAKGAAEAAAGILSFVNHHLADLISADKDRLLDVDQAIRRMTETSRQYLAQADVSRAIADVPGNASRALSHPLFTARLIPAALRSFLPTSFALLTDPAVRAKYNDDFVTQELAGMKTFFDDLGGVSLSDQQREACIRLEDSNLLVAAAGSGKSATMVGKVGYALAKGLYAPEDILVLAFNRKAAEELEERIARQQGLEKDALGARVTTFHALGRGIIQEVEGRPPQLANWIEHPAGEARVISEIVDHLVDTDEEFRNLWVDLLTLQAKADLAPADFDTAEDYRRYIADRVTTDGDMVGTLSQIFVRSLQEQRIANWLWIHSIDFEYERQIGLPQKDGTIRHVEPDFYYPLTGTYHEHFAINADGTSPFENYVHHTALKRAGYQRAGIDIFETTSAQATNGSLLSRLEAELVRRKVPLQRKTTEEILKAVQPVVITHYHKVIGICIKHIRSSRLTLNMLLEKAKTLKDQRRATSFAKAVWAITQAYSGRLEQEGRIDFDSMIGDAVRLVETGRYQSPYSLILVDEFQDISEPRANLIKALKHQKAFSKVFAVGDDWQSIYRFAGSDITMFTQFEANFGTSWQGRLEQTYRCNQLIADASATFVQKNPAQITKTVRSSRPAIPKSIRAIPITVKRGKPSFQEACFELLKRLDGFLHGIADQWRTQDRQRLKVLVLWRYNHLDPFHGHRPTYTNIDVAGLSFHRSKGLEADYTILLDVSEGDYGVPSRIEDDELLNLVIPRPETFPYAEERRLFYVAMTRASRGSYLLYNSRDPSRYIREMQEIVGSDLRFETIKGREIRMCPKCMSGQMVERSGPNDSKFLGCSRYPNCTHTIDMPVPQSTAGGNARIASRR